MLRMFFPHPYHLDESTFILGAMGVFFFFFHFYRLHILLQVFISFFDENHVSKQNSPRWNAAFCGVTSWATLFDYVS